MSAEQPTTYHVRFLRGQVSTTITVGSRPVQLVAGPDGQVRQIRRGVADPCVDEEIAAELRGMRGWHVEPWPAGYQPEEQVITLNAGEPLPGETADEAEGRLRRQMLSRLKAIGRTAQINVTDAEGEIIALTQKVAELEGRVQSAEAERDTAMMEANRLRALIDQQGRTHSASLPHPNEDMPERHAPTASELGMGPNLKTLRERGETGEESWPDQETDEDDDPTVEEAVAGALQGLGGNAPTPSKRKAARAAREG